VILEGGTSHFSWNTGNKPMYTAQQIRRVKMWKFFRLMLSPPALWYYLVCSELNKLPTTYCSWLCTRFCNSKDHNIGGVDTAPIAPAAWWVGGGQTHRILKFAADSFGLYFVLQTEGSIILRVLGVTLLIILGRSLTNYLHQCTLW